MKKELMGLSFALLAGVCTMAQVPSPHGFRGANREGNYANESGLMKQWPAEGPQMLWENLEIGKGYSSPVVVGDRLYVTGMTEDEKQETFHAFTLDGKKVYTVVYGSPFDQNYPETRTTPTIDNGKAYVISGMGEVVCINCADGKINWKVDGKAQYASKTGNWGTAESPLVYDNKVIYTPGGDNTAIVALDKETGKEVWKSKSLNDGRAYVSPTMIDWKGKRQMIASTQHVVFGVTPANGEIEWEFRDWGRPDGGRPMANGYRPENIAPNSSLFREGMLFFSQGYDIGGYMLKLNDTLTDATLAWKTDDLDTHHGGYVLLNGVIYGSNWLNNTSGNWVAIDWNTGKTIYNTAWKGGKGKGSIIAADGMLYAYDERRGFVGLLQPGSELNVVSEFRITKGEGPYWAHLAIHNGVLYVRHGSALQAYKIK